MMLEHYDALTNLFAGSVLVEPLNFGLESTVSSESLDIHNNKSSLADVKRDDLVMSPDSERSRERPTPCNNNRTFSNDENCVPKLIDDNRKHLF